MDETPRLYMSIEVEQVGRWYDVLEAAYAGLTDSENYELAHVVEKIKNQIGRAIGIPPGAERV